MSCNTSNENVICNPTFVCCGNSVRMVSGCGGAWSNSAPTPPVGCDAPATNPFVGRDAYSPIPRYTPVQPSWNPSAKPASLLPAPPLFAQAIYRQYFGLNAIPSTAG